MGMSINTKIGPYLKVDGKHKVNTPKVKRVCPNHPKKETNDKFCAQCGTLIESVDYVETKTLTGQDFYYQSDVYEDDVFWFPEYCDAILPNDYPPNKIEIDIDGLNSVDLTNIGPIIDKQVMWFKEKYAKQIAAFVNTFGEHNVRVCWGVVTFYS